MVVLLANALSEFDVAVAAAPESARVGRVRGLYLWNRIASVLVYRLGSGPCDDARYSAEAVDAEGLRISRARLARLHQTLASIYQSLSAAGRIIDATRAFGPLDRKHGFRDQHYSWLAHDDLPALLRRWCHLFRFRDGTYAHHSSAFLVQDAGHHHDAPHRSISEGNARDGIDCCLRIHPGSVLLLVQRRQIRELHVLEPHHGSIWLRLRAPDPLQYCNTASAVVRQSTTECAGAVVHFD